MLILTIDHVPNQEINEVAGLCRGTSVRAKHIGKDIFASFKNIVGGEISEYREMMDESRQIAVSRMVEDAEAKGCNAIIGFRIQTSTIAQGVSEITAYGTAVKI